MELQILFSNGIKKNITINTIWQDQIHGMDVLYYEDINSEKGNGTFIKIKDIQCWQVVQVDNNIDIKL